MTAKSKICPFCAHAGEMSLCAQHMGGGVTHVWVQCGKCSARGPAAQFPSGVSTQLEVQELAIFRWNVRRPDVRRAMDAEFFGVARRLDA